MKKWIFAVWAGLLLGLLAIQPAMAFEASHEAAVRRFLNAIQVKELLTSGFEQGAKAAPARKGLDIQALVNEFKVAVDSDEFIAKMVPIYAQYLSEKQVTELAAFYESPVGVKMIQEITHSAREGRKPDLSPNKFTPQELQMFMDFSSSPVLQDFLSVQPAISTALNDLASQYGVEIARRVMHNSPESAVAEKKDSQ